MTRRTVILVSTPLGLKILPDVDLDLRAPLHQVARKSGILSPISRLVNARPLPLRTSSTVSSLRPDAHGWSGSVSEEEDYVSEVRRLSRRKSSHTAPTTPKFKRPSKDKGTSSRFSQFSEASDTSISTVDSASTLLTPSSSAHSITMNRLERLSSTGSIPCDFPWGRSTASSRTGSPFGKPTKGFYESVKAKGPAKLPKPWREVHGWGPPEILIDEDWPSTSDTRSYRSEAGSEVAEITPRMMYASKAPSPGCVIRGAEDGWVLDEELPALIPSLVKGFDVATLKAYHAM